MLDEGFMAEARAKTVRQEREEVCAGLQYAASFHCLVKEWTDCEELKPKPREKWIFVNQKKEETRHRTEWCAETNKYRCMRCGRGSKYMKMPGKCTGPKYLEKNLGTWGKRHSGGHDTVRRMYRQGEALIWCTKCSGYARQSMGQKLMNCCKSEQVGTKEYGKMLKRIQVLEDGRIFAKEAKNWKIEGHKKTLQERNTEDCGMSLKQEDS